MTNTNGKDAPMTNTSDAVAAMDLDTREQSIVRYMARFCKKDEATLTEDDVIDLLGTFDSDERVQRGYWREEGL